VDGIPKIQINNISIPRNIINTPTPSILQTQPLTLDLQSPNLIFEIPGCIEAHPDSGGNKQLKQDDNRGVKTYCDAGMPSFNAIDYRPEDIQPTPQPTTPKINTKKDESNSQERNDDTSTTNQNINIPLNIPCPRPGDPPIGAVGKYGGKIIAGYEKVGNLCKTIYEDRTMLEIIDTYTPPPTTLINTSAIAIGSVLGVTLLGQPLAKFFQKKLKGQVKKLSKKFTKKILALRGKKPKVLSLRERQVEQRNLRK